MASLHARGGRGRALLRAPLAPRQQIPFGQEAREPKTPPEGCARGDCIAFPFYLYILIMIIQF